VVLVFLIGTGIYLSDNSNGAAAPEDTSGEVSEEAVEAFTARLRAETVARVGQPIEGFEPFMFMRAFPGLVASDFNDVDALIGLYRYQNGEVVYDLNGEVETHSAARAISDEGMEQLLVHVATRLNYSVSDESEVDNLIDALAPNPAAGGGGTTLANGEPIAVNGVITCLPHKGDGPHTLECAFGLKADDGAHYGLSNLWTVAPELTETDVAVRVSGTFVNVLPDEKYDIQGYIDVQSAVKR